MASESEREEAKRSISSRETTDAEMDSALKEGQNLQLGIIRENNRHTEAKIKADLGWFGKFFGGENSAPVFVALVAMVAGLVGAGVAMAFAAWAKDTAMTEFWGKQVERAAAFASAALAFIFGRGSKK